MLCLEVMAKRAKKVRRGEHRVRAAVLTSKRSQAVGELSLEGVAEELAGCSNERSLGWKRKQLRNSDDKLAQAGGQEAVAVLSLAPGLQLVPRSSF